MLLELHDLDRSLSEAGILPRVTEQRIQPYPKRPALEVGISRDGQIAKLKLLDESQVQAIRKFECSKGGFRESTPGFNVDPLWRTKVGNSAFESCLEDLRKKFPEKSNPTLSDVFESWLKEWRKRWKAAAGNPAKIAQLIEERASQSEANWELSGSSKIDICLKRAATTLRNELLGATDPKLLTLLELLTRSEALDARRLHGMLAEAIRMAATNGAGGLTPDDCRKFLYSDREPGSRKPAPNEGFSLVLELDDAYAFDGYPVNHQVVWDALNDHLLAKQDPSVSGGATAIGIFGEPLPLKLGSMPERTLPRVGKVKLFSLSAQTPCQFRYRLIESAACPVGPEVQDRLSAALDWICHADRDGQTWADVSNSCGYKQPALLLAFPSKIPAKKSKLSGLMVGGRVRDPQTRLESGFEKQAKPVIETLKGLMVEDSNITITVVVIAKADTARKKLLYSRQFAARRMIAAASEWQESARNFPPIRIRIFRDRTPDWQWPLIPFPDELVQLINACWDSVGEKSKPVSNVRIGLGLALLLETGPPLKAAVHEALQALVRNVTPLVQALARAHIENRVAAASSASNLPLLVPSILGLLLAKAGHSKGEYMRQNAYLIGRLMSLADEFHREYCKHERKNQFPPQFIGNSLLPTALENPVTGLARLSERLPLYQRVAKTELRDKAGAIEQAIDKDNLPRNCTDMEKAQMLLGYLARPDVQVPTEVTTDSDDTNPEETQS